LKDGDVIVDIGAHRGIVSCYLAKKYPMAQVYAYEPVSKNFKGLLDNIMLNGLPNIKPYNLAVTGDGRNITITTQPGNSGGASIYGTGEYSEEVPSITLENILKEHAIDRIALPKIDCEGAEFEIIPNHETLKRIDRLRGEFHKSGGDAIALLELVKVYVPDVIVTVTA
jgi:FkbM family methyltransferase